MNKKMLRESIMRNVRRSLNEAFAFESDPIGDEILNIVSKNENIANIVKDANDDDWKELINKIKEMANNRMTDVKMPAKITNIDALAKAFISKMNIDNVNAIKKMEDTEIDGIIAYLNSDADGDGDGDGKDNNDTPALPFEAKKPNVKECNCGGKGCNEEKKDVCPKCGKNPCVCKKETNESRNARRNAKRLNENARRRRLNERPEDTFEVYSEIYQHLCDCQDLAEEIGDFNLMSQFEDMRHTVDMARFRH